MENNTQDNSGQLNEAAHRLNEAAALLQSRLSQNTFPAENALPGALSYSTGGVAFGPGQLSSMLKWMLKTVGERTKEAAEAEDKAELERLKKRRRLRLITEEEYENTLQKIQEKAGARCLRAESESMASARALDMGLTGTRLATLLLRLLTGAATGNPGSAILAAMSGAGRLAVQAALPAYARGSAYSMPGWAWVGEEGPELIKLPAGTEVKDNRQSAEMAARAGEIDYDKLARAMSRISLTVNISELESALEQSGLRRQRARR